MPSKDPILALHAIIENISLARQFLGKMSAAELTADIRTLYAVIRCLEIVSEASRRLPEEMKQRHSDVPWANISGAGNIYRHDYERIDVQGIWKAAKFGLDALEPAVADELSRRKP